MVGADVHVAGVKKHEVAHGGNTSPLRHEHAADIGELDQCGACPRCADGKPLAAFLRICQ